MKLAREEVDARMVIYDEIMGHLDMDICETATERVQADIVQKQIRAISKSFYKKHTQ